MSGYMTRLFPKSNSSFLLSSGNALQAKVVRLRDQMYLVHAGAGPPREATRDELVGVPNPEGPVRFTNRVGYLSPSSRESPIKNQMLERCFVDLVTGDPGVKARATARFADMLGQNDVGGGGEQPLLLPRVFRKKRVWTELSTKFRSNSKVKGFVAEKVRGGYSIAIAGYLAFFSVKSLINRRGMGDRFVIEKMNPKTMEMVVTRA